MKIIYTKHTEDKLKTVEAKKFKINKNKIEVVVRGTELVINSRVARLIGKLDKDHSLCVILRKEKNSLKIITFFPTEKERYESKIL